MSDFKWVCSECGQVCYSTVNPTEGFPKWKDGHVCKFKLEHDQEDCHARTGKYHCSTCGRCTDYLGCPDCDDNKVCEGCGDELNEKEIEYNKDADYNLCFPCLKGNG